MQTQLSNGRHKAGQSGLPINFDDARQKLAALNTRAVALIKEKPAAVLFGALCVGFLIGRLASRR